ncbi:hypothetical protein E2C01_060236 [Portunus trituberculatus]|uniref:Uncharacterized protein n=1 Tax=Portunus trituberculatus TaxID=210409 RepID=A0A5B7H7I1_PORTR|nr:hypothetical protein [Portunus trituberculatus]
MASSHWSAPRSRLCLRSKAKGIFVLYRYQHRDDSNPANALPTSSLTLHHPAQTQAPHRLADNRVKSTSIKTQHIFFMSKGCEGEKEGRKGR